MDTPETEDPHRPVQCFGREASARTQALIPSGSPVRLVYDVERTDRYRRTLAYVYRLPDGLFVNAVLVKEGFAQVATFPPNVAHVDDLRRPAAPGPGGQRRPVGGVPGIQPANTSTTTTGAPPACHPSYRGTCIPPDVSDADCAGGSGEGPHDVREKNIEVVGPDEYGLDADNDGVGCEDRSR